MFDVLGFTLATVDEATIPPGAFVELPGRGRPFVVDIAGPPGCEERPPVFLIHGLIASSYLNWAPAFAALSAHFRVLAMDLRGHGRGIPLGHRTFRLADCADDIAAVLDALGVPRCIPVGYSLGGPVAQLMWRRHPDRVSGLVLAATSRNFMGTMQERLFFQSLVGVAAAARSMPWAGRETLTRPPPPDPADGVRMSAFALEEVKHTSPGTALQAMSALGRFSSHEWIGEIDVPTAVVVTTKDRAIGPHRQIKLANAIPGATIHPTKAGHAACFFSADLFVPTLVAACTSVASRIEAG